MWFCTYVIIYGMLTWLPTVWGTVYHMKLAEALRYQSIYSAIAAPGFLITIFLIDFLGRRRMFMLGLGVGGILMLFLAANPMPRRGRCSSSSPSRSSRSACSPWRSAPTRLSFIRPSCARSAAASAMPGSGSPAPPSPAFIGAVLPIYGLKAVFFAFGLLLLVGFVVCFFFAVETRGQVLEQLSPSLPRRRAEATAPGLCSIPSDDYAGG